MSQENLRLLCPADLGGAVELSRDLWNQTIDDWEMLLRRIRKAVCDRSRWPNCLDDHPALLWKAAGLDWDGIDQAGVQAPRVRQTTDASCS